MSTTFDKLHAEYQLSHALWGKKKRGGGGYDVYADQVSTRVTFFHFFSFVKCLLVKGPHYLKICLAP